MVAAAARHAPPLLDAAVTATVACLVEGGRVWTLGNGGSAAQAQHAAAELVGNFELPRGGLPAVALTADSATITSVANDIGFDQVFARQITAMSRSGDLVLALSTSGNSPDVVEGVMAAQAVGCRVIGFSGHDGGAMAPHCDVLVTVPSERVARIQELHQLYLHVWVDEVEQRLADRPSPATT